MLKLSAKAVKTTLVVDPAGLFGAQVAEGSSRVPFEIAAGGRVVRGEFNGKSLRRAIAAAEAGDCAVIIQGKLETGDVLAEAGISAMPKVKKDAVGVPASLAV